MRTVCAVSVSIPPLYDERRKKVIRPLRDLCEGRKEYLSHLCEEKKAAVEDAPEGRLRISVGKGRILYYHRLDPKDKNGRYIPVDKTDMAARLAQKSYDEAILQASQKEWESLDCFLRRDTGLLPEEIYENLSQEKQKLVVPIREEDSVYAEKWQKVPYAGKGFDQNVPEFYTARGERVRSKSEVLIADMLYRMGVPYRYECPVNLEGLGTVHPDFMVLNTATRKVYLWEHFGRMEDPKYSARTLNKLNAYYRTGYYPGENMIMTFESANVPIDMRNVKMLINWYCVGENAAKARMI